MSLLIEPKIRSAYPAIPAAAMALAQIEKSLREQGYSDPSDILALQRAALKAALASIDPCIKEWI